MLSFDPGRGFPVRKLSDTLTGSQSYNRQTSAENNKKCMGSVIKNKLQLIAEYKAVFCIIFSYIW
jgi:hypothetical protein